jgi:hypothetical protein
MPDSEENANELVDHQPALTPSAEAARAPVALQKFEPSVPLVGLLLLLLATALLAAVAAWLRPDYRFLIGVVGGTLLGILALWLLPKWQVTRLQLLEPRDLFAQENEARKTLAQIIGGILVLAGLYYTNENIKITQSVADQTQKAAIESRELTREGQTHRPFHQGGRTIVEGGF